MAEGQVDFEFYETPPFCTEWLCDEVAFEGTVVDPCVGAGAMTKVIGTRYPSTLLVTNDLDPRWPATAHEDASKPAYWQAFLPGVVDWVAANPAFSIASPLLQHAWPVVKKGIAMHVRLSFLEPLKRGLRRGQLRELPPTQVLVLPRIRYRLNDRGAPSSDSVACCWLVWRKDDATWLPDAERLVHPNTHQHWYDPYGLPGTPGLVLEPIKFAPDWVIDAATAWRPAT